MQFASRRTGAPRLADKQGLRTLAWVLLAGTLAPRLSLASELIPTYGTYFGGSGDINVAVAVAVDASNNVIVAGYTTSQTLPGTQNAYQPAKATGFPDNRNVFVAKFNSTGTSLLWATFLGGSGNDMPTSLAVDSTGSIYVVGTTTSTNFPVTLGAFQTTPSSGFATKISADGKSLLYGTFLPGVANALAVNSTGEAYMTGVFSSSVISPGAIGNPAPSSQGDGGVSVLRLNATGTGLIFGAYLGGGGFTGSTPTAIAIDARGDAYVAGLTGAGLPAEASPVLTTANAFQPTPSNGPQTGFLLEVNATGSQLLYGTYFGPQYSETAVQAIALAPNGSVYLAGSISTTALWATQGAYLSTPSGEFVAKLTPGTLALDAFSFVPGESYFPSPETYNPPDSLWITLSQSSTLYLGFQSVGGAGFNVVELNGPTLSLISSSAFGFAPLGVALSLSNSVWLVGLIELGSSCPTCSVGALISPNAFESSPPSPNGESAVIAELSPLLPTISVVQSAASGTSPVVAGEVISIYGSQLGPLTGATGQVTSNLLGSSAGGTTVLFDSIASPILYSRTDIVNTAIPCEVAGHASTQLVVEYQGVQSPPVTVPLSPAAPAIFTADSSGKGQGLVFNADYSQNSPTNPAARGSAVFFYATGLGAMSPACVDGLVYTSNFPSATLPVVAGVGNVGAQVLYAGQAPDLMAGVVQINIVIPTDVSPGSLPLTLVVNGTFSPPGVMIAVK